MTDSDWDDILARHGPSVWRTAHRLLGNPDDADECLQDVFVSAFELALREPVRDWPAVLKVLATNRALDLLRRRNRFANLLRKTAAERTVAAAQLGADASIPADDLAARLRWALARIPPNHAAVFCLCELTDLAHREVAELRGITVEAVAVLLHRARARLRELLTPATADERLR